MNNVLHNNITLVLPYDLSIMLSYLTRLNNPNSSLEDSLVIESWLLSLLDSLELWEVTLSVHNDHSHISQILQQIELIIKLIDHHVKWLKVNAELWKRIQILLEGYKNKLQSIPSSPSREFYLTREKIEDIFQSPWLFQSWSTILTEELRKWWNQKTHPNTMWLDEALDINRIKDLMRFAVEEVFWSKMPDVNYHDAKDSRIHRLFWNQNTSWTNYIVAPYRLADYLSFEFPHNATHLVHLSKFKKSVHAYSDSMPERSFFEWLAVLSEHFEYERFSRDRELWVNLHESLWLQGKWISKEFLRDFLIADRVFEFRLRAVRLMWDLMVMEGFSLDDIIQEVCVTFWLDSQTARAEITKYYSHTGLWGIYTFWYLRLLQGKVTNPVEVFEKDATPRVWQDLKDL